MLFSSFKYLFQRSWIFQRVDLTSTPLLYWDVDAFKSPSAFPFRGSLGCAGCYVSITGSARTSISDWVAGNWLFIFSRND